MSKHEEFEDRLRKAIRPDRERFDVPEGYFTDFKSRMMAQVKKQASVQPIEGESYRVKINWWILPSLMAACLTLFVLFRPVVETEKEHIDSVLSEVSIVPVETTDIELNSQEVEAIAETALAEQYEYEMALEAVYSDSENEQDDFLVALDNVETEAMEEFLIDNLNLYSEL